MKDRVLIDELKHDLATSIDDHEIESEVDTLTTDPEELCKYLELTDDLVDALAQLCLDSQPITAIQIIRDQAQNYYLNSGWH